MDQDASEGDEDIKSGTAGDGDSSGDACASDFFDVYKGSPEEIMDRVLREHPMISALEQTDHERMRDVLQRLHPAAVPHFVKMSSTRSDTGMPVAPSEGGRWQPQTKSWDTGGVTSSTRPFLATPYFFWDCVQQLLRLQGDL